MGILCHGPRVRAPWGIFSLVVLLLLSAAMPRQCYGQAADADTKAADDAAAGDAAAGDTAAAEAPYVPNPAEVAGHTAWMLTSSALVLFMTAPGLAMFYGGLVRKKNVLGVMMQCVFLMGLMTVIWALYGYSWRSASENRSQAVHRQRATTCS